MASSQELTSFIKCSYIRTASCNLFGKSRCKSEMHKDSFRFHSIVYLFAIKRIENFYCRPFPEFRIFTSFPPSATWNFVWFLNIFEILKFEYCFVFQLRFTSKFCIKGLSVLAAMILEKSFVKVQEDLPTPVYFDLLCCVQNLWTARSNNFFSLQLPSSLPALFLF